MMESTVKSYLAWLPFSKISIFPSFGLSWISTRGSRSWFLACCFQSITILLDKPVESSMICLVVIPSSRSLKITKPLICPIIGSVNGSHSASRSDDFTLELSLKLSLQPKGSLCFAISLLFLSTIEIVEFLDRFIKLPLLSLENLKFWYLAIPSNWRSIMILPIWYELFVRIIYNRIS